MLFFRTKSSRLILLSVFALLVQLPLAAQKITVSGYIKDAASGEPVAGAVVFSRDIGVGSVSGNAGFYSISFDAGVHTLVYNTMGYEEKQITQDFQKNITLNIALDAADMQLKEAVVTAHKGELGVLGTQMSAVDIPVGQIKSIPAIGGEVDVLKALQLLPGVQSGTEGTAGIYVRGGGADENLLLLDGVPLYNVNHLFGFFSVFNADALRGVTLYKGSFPARFGGHLSSVIDVRMNDGNDSEYHGNVSVGLISAKLNVEGPIVKGKTTFNISARRTYYDLLLAPILAYASKQYGDGEKYSGGYDFYDLNVKLTHKFNNDDRLSLAVYSGDDAARVKMKYTETETDAGGTLKSTEIMKGSWRWGNVLGVLRYSHALTPNMFMTTSVNYTHYRNSLGVGESIEEEMKYAGSSKKEKYFMEMGVNYNSLVNDISANADFDWYPHYRHDVKFGAGYTFHMFKPGIVSMTVKQEGSMDEPLDREDKVGEDDIFSNECSAYIEDSWTATDWLKLNLGLRASMYYVGKPYFSLEPRVSARALAMKDLSFKLSYSEMSQYIHLLSNSNLSMPSDLWVPVTKNIKPMRSRQVAAGAFYELGKFEFSVEGYYKTMDNVLEYKDGASYLGMSTGWEEKVCMGRGWSYGVEFMVQKKIGKTTGWIGYTWSKSMRKFDREGMVINDGNPFPAKYDRTHDLSITVSHKFNKHFDLSSTFIYASGNCGSLALDKFDSGIGWRTSEYIPYRNNYRMPSYHRLDIGMNFYRYHKRIGMGIWNISIYNVYNSMNPFIVMLGRDWKTDTPVLKKYTIFPIIPSVSYTFKF